MRLNGNQGRITSRSDATATTRQLFAPPRRRHQLSFEQPDAVRSWKMAFGTEKNRTGLPRERRTNTDTVTTAATHSSEADQRIQNRSGVSHLAIPFGGISTAS